MDQTASLVKNGELQLQLEMQNSKNCNRITTLPTPEKNNKSKKSKIKTNILHNSRI
jgi:hypothetical protein